MLKHGLTQQCLGTGAGCFLPSSGGGHVDLSQLDKKGAGTGASTGGSGLGLDAEISAAGKDGRAEDGMGWEDCSMVPCWQCLGVVQSTHLCRHDKHVSIIATTESPVRHDSYKSCISIMNSGHRVPSPHVAWLLGMRSSDVYAHRWAWRWA
jgi:hypothetical protein